MPFDLAAFQQELSVPKKIATQPSGHMLLYEAKLVRVERLRSDDGKNNNTAELFLKLIWWHHASGKPRATTVHSFASVLHHGELTDFAKIINSFLPDDKKLESKVDMLELVTLSHSIVEAINSSEIYCFCFVNGKNRIGKKLERFEITENVNHRLSRELCDSIRELEWHIPVGYEHDKKYQELAALNRKRWLNNDEGA